MTNDNQRALAETVFEREQRREREISEALKMEARRRHREHAPFAGVTLGARGKIK
jgi:hypothetical protein